MLCHVVTHAEMLNLGQKAGGRKQLPGVNVRGKSHWAGAGEKTERDKKPGGSEGGRRCKMWWVLHCSLETRKKLRLGGSRQWPAGAQQGATYSHL